MKYFEIPQNKYVEKMKADYAHCTEECAMNSEECLVFRIFNRLSEEERILCMAMSEYKSSRKVAKVLGTNNNYASKALKELKAKIADIASEEMANV